MVSTKCISIMSIAILGGSFIGVVNAADTCMPTSPNRPVCPAGAPPETATFIDPTVVIANPSNVYIGPHTYIAPFAGLNSPAINIGKKTNLQDSVILGGSGEVILGDEVILAHGARVNGPAKIGRHAVVGENNPSFIGFNSLVNGATVEHDAMVLHMARVNPGITIRHGRVVLSGKDIRTQEQADNPALGKVIPITGALRAFMGGVLHVNETFAREYSRLYYENPSYVKGINYDPGNSDFNPARNLPTIAGVPTRNPGYRNRIIGDVHLADSKPKLHDDEVIGDRISLRTDEGEPFHVGHITRMGNRTTFHALEHTGIETHDHVKYGFRSLVHGGASDATAGNVYNNTVVGENNKIGDYAVFFRSVSGADVKVGCGSVIDGATLAPGTLVPPLTVVMGTMTYPVEWNPGCELAIELEVKKSIHLK